jgi:HlyD family secretion protein
MKRAFALPLLAGLGFIGAAIAVLHDTPAEHIPTPPIQVASSPYASSVAGAGLVEASTGNIAIGTPVSGIVMAIYVKVGDQVKVGDPLFKIDDRDLQARLVTARARVNQAAAALQKPRHRLAHAERLAAQDPAAISEQAMDDLRDDAARSAAALVSSQAQLSQLQAQIERHTVRALVAGEILQAKMRLGEFVEASGTTPALLILGDSHRLHLRVDVDEHDAWRVRPGAAAVAYVRGQPAMKIPLHYAYTEPYMVPKTALTGQSTERTDTRVLQVIYSFAQPSIPVFTGQLLDVFIEAGNTATGEAGQ